MPLETARVGNDTLTSRLRFPADLFVLLACLLTVVTNLLPIGRMPGQHGDIPVTTITGAEGNVLHSLAGILTGVAVLMVVLLAAQILAPPSFRLVAGAIALFIISNGAFVMWLGVKFYQGFHGFDRMSVGPGAYVLILAGLFGLTGGLMEMTRMLAPREAAP